MKRATLSLAVAAAVTCALVLGGTGTAMADATHSINLNGPSTGYVNQPMLIQATGANPDPSEWWDISYIEAVALPASTIPVCPDNAQDAGQIAESAGGELLDIALQPHEDAVGNYTNQIGFTPWARGNVLICGYEYNDVGSTQALSALSIDVHCSCELQQEDPAPQSTPAPPSSGAPAAAVAAKPVNTKLPRLTKSKKAVVCKAGTWSNSSAYSYSWLVNGKKKKGADGSRLAVTRKLRGRDVKCGVTATGSGGSTTVFSKALHIGK